MKRALLIFAGVFFLLATASLSAQQAEATSEPAPMPSVPAASRSQVDCSGFITGTPIVKDLYVMDGEENETHNPYRMFGTWRNVFLKSRTGQSIPVGSEYSLVRPAKELMRIKWYPGQGASVRSLGTPYEDVGRVKVTHITQEGAVAEITFACTPISPDDLVVPYQQRPIPEYTPAKLERYTPESGKQLGAITAAADNAGFLAKGMIAYINLGQEDGAAPGQRYRIFRIVRDPPAGRYRASPDTPRETIGELLILSTQERSSVGIVTGSRREISLGDGVELQ